MVMDFAVGAAAGVAASEISEKIHPEEVSHMVQHLSYLSSTINELCRFLKAQAINKGDVWKPLRIFSDHPIRVPEKDYTFLYLFFGQNTHIQIVNGLFPTAIDWNPNVGMNLFKFPDSTTLQLIDPVGNIIIPMLFTETMYS